MEQPISLKQFFTTHPRILSVCVVVLVGIGVGWYVISNRAPALGSYVVTTGNVISTVNIPGTVSSSNSVDLSFQESGKIAKIDVQEGQTVTAGEILASLDDSTQETQLTQEEAALAAAQATLSGLENGTRPEQLAVTQAQVASDQTNLQNVQAQQATLVGNALNAELNAGLQIQTVSDSITPEYIPTLSGTYTGTQQGEYDITTHGGSGAYFSYSGIETGTGSIANSNNSTPVPLGSDGLFLSFPAGFSNMNDTNWVISIPNTKSSQYLSAQNAYTAALSTQKNAIANAQAVLSVDEKNLALEQAGATSQNIDAQKAAVAGAQAAIESAQLAINNASIVAPFAGIARNVTAQLGMVVSPNVPVLSVINNGILKIDAYASETDVPKILVNADAVVTLDAYGTTAPFPAKVTAVDTTETMSNGSPAYHITLYFTAPDPRIRAGMTGNVLVTAAEHDDVVEVPARLILTNANKSYVLVKQGGKNTLREVVCGITGDDGMVEIVSGLSAGETLSSF